MLTSEFRGSKTLEASKRAGHRTGCRVGGGFGRKGQRFRVGAL